MELHQFDKIKMARKSKDNQVWQTTSMTGQSCLCRYVGGIHAPQQCPAHGKMCTRCGKTGHFRKVCWSRRDHVVHELEVEVAQETQEGKIETVSIDSVHLNRHWLLITAHLEMQAGKNFIEIPYKIDMGSEGNIMLLYIFQKLFKNAREEQLKEFIKSHTRLCT